MKVLKWCVGSTHLVHLSDRAELCAKVLQPLDLRALGVSEGLQLTTLLLTLSQRLAQLADLLL